MNTQQIQPSFKRTFLTGLIIVLPLFVSVWVVLFIFRQVDRAVTPLVLQFIKLFSLGHWTEQAWINYLAPLVSVILAVVFIYLLGLIGGNVLGRQLLAGIDRLLMQVPFVRGIYSATRQFLDTFSGSKGRAFRHVALIEYPRPGLWTMGFVTGTTEGEVQSRTKEKVVNVFLPTTPNPTSGWLVFVPEKDVICLDMSVDDAIKMVISGGVLTPGISPSTNSAQATKPIILEPSHNSPR